MAMLRLSQMSINQMSVVLSIVYICIYGRDQRVDPHQRVYIYIYI